MSESLVDLLVAGRIDDAQRVIDGDLGAHALALLPDHDSTLFVGVYERRPGFDWIGPSAVARLARSWEQFDRHFEACSEARAEAALKRARALLRAWALNGLAADHLFLVYDGDDFCVVSYEPSRGAAYPRAEGTFRARLRLGPFPPG
ncbi:MAG: hypothetical protein AAF645_29380 [Myxococcota bacterium]